MSELIDIIQRTLAGSVLMFSNYNNWNGGSPRDSEIEIHKLKTQDMRNDTHHYYDPEVPDFDKNKNGYYDQFEKKQEPFPWRRLFARSLDLTIYTTIFEAIAALGFRINLLETGFIYNVISIVLTLVLKDCSIRISFKIQKVE
ncbi:MAG: hypothetical protein E7253_10235 [Lachnospiraceae bacterium]|nr:hypothetical protein [Lachnospiraceae bacterium]